MAAIYTFVKKYTPNTGGREFSVGDKIPSDEILPDLAKTLVENGYCEAPKKKKRAAVKKAAQKKK